MISEEVCPRMAKRRKATPVTLADSRRERL
jgi:hypothetical protein